MPVPLAEPKRVAVRELPPGHPLREMILRLPDDLSEAQFDTVAPILVGLARVRGT